MQHVVGLGQAADGRFGSFGLERGDLRGRGRQAVAGIGAAGGVGGRIGAARAAGHQHQQCGGGEESEACHGGFP